MIGWQTSKLIKRSDFRGAEAESCSSMLLTIGWHQLADRSSNGRDKALCLQPSDQLPSRRKIFTTVVYR